MKNGFCKISFIFVNMDLSFNNQSVTTKILLAVLAGPPEGIMSQSFDLGLFLLYVCNLDMFLCIFLTFFVCKFWDALPSTRSL